MVRGFVSWHFSLRRFNHLAKGLEMRQGVWGRVPVGLVSIVTHVLLTHLTPLPASVEIRRR
jgi:hypothetical protein